MKQAVTGCSPSVHRSVTVGREILRALVPVELDQARKYVEELPELLARDFGDLPIDRIRPEVKVVGGWLFSVARFYDFVPVLADRYARERLRDLLGRGAP